jgi:hypothetical protein
LRYLFLYQFIWEGGDNLLGWWWWEGDEIWWWRWDISDDVEKYNNFNKYYDNTFIIDEQEWGIEKIDEWGGEE